MLQLTPYLPPILASSAARSGWSASFIPGLVISPFTLTFTTSLLAAAFPLTAIGSTQGRAVHVKPLSILFRAKFRDQLKKTGLFHSVNPDVWKKDWVVHCQPVGSGNAAFKYLAPYIFRVAIGNKRIHKLENGRVTFSYKESATDQIKFANVSAEEFIRRFLQHVLPDHFVKVRYYGLLSPSNRHLLARSRQLLAARSLNNSLLSQDPAGKTTSQSVLCPTCGGVLKFVQRLKPQPRRPP